MDAATLLRLVSCMSLRRLFLDWRALPWELDARAGILRIDGEPVVVPRAWLDGGHRIFSLRRLFDGDSLATAEFVPGPDGWVLRQLRGYRNAVCVSRDGAVHEPFVDIMAALGERLPRARPSPARRAA